MEDTFVSLSIKFAWREGIVLVPGFGIGMRSIFRGSFH